MHGATPRRSSLDAPLIALIGALVLLAWINRFVQDDAFISFQYARNLVEGHGLVFNPGERVEGYTNFLWTLMIAAGLAAGFEPVAWSYGLGLALFAGSLWLTGLLARDLSGSGEAGLIAVLLVGTNYSFSAYATGGLETQLQAFLVVAAVWLSLAGIPRMARASVEADGTSPSAAGPRAAAGGGMGASLGLLAAASAAYGAALMTRLDSVVCLLVPGLVTLAACLRGGDATGRSGVGARVARVGALLLPGTVLVAPWLFWKVSYYGVLLPNTFYVKVTSAASIARGGHYVYRFLASYWLLPLVLLGLTARPRRLAEMLRGGSPPWGGAVAAAVAMWCAYVAAVGGDFMEFRFIVPVLPLGMALVGWCLVAVVEERRVRLALVALLAIGSALHAFTFFGVRDIETIDSLAIHMEPDGGDWDEVGRALGEHFPAGSGVLIAVGPAGAIPYYSRLPALDMRGLIDPWVARHGIIVSTVPGHQRMAPMSYLIERGVNLVVGHPQVVPRAGGLPGAFPLAGLAQLGLADATNATVPEGARVLAIPMSGERWLLVLYLVAHPDIERAIAEQRWAAIPLSRAVRPF
jgi:arabinofuranosyltransferase